jgi:hypothetical protein
VVAAPVSITYLPVGFQKSVTCGEQQFHAARSYSLIKPPSTGRRLMRSWLEVRDGVGWLRWAKVTGAVRPSTVVVPNVFHEHDTQVPLVEDQHAVGEFGSEGSDETVRRNSSPADIEEESGPPGCPPRPRRHRMMR